MKFEIDTIIIDEIFKIFFSPKFRSISKIISIEGGDYKENIEKNKEHLTEIANQMNIATIKLEAILKSLNVLFEKELEECFFTKNIAPTQQTNYVNYLKPMFLNITNIVVDFLMLSKINQLVDPSKNYGIWNEKYYDNPIENEWEQLLIIMDWYEQGIKETSSKFLKINETTNPITTPNHENIFCNNGFVLFDHILNEYVKTDRGRLSDIHFFYWSMYNNDPQYIHQRPERFKEWFFDNYDNEDLGKIKTYDQVNNIDRQKHYSNALVWFKHQK